MRRSAHTLRIFSHTYWSRWAPLFTATATLAGVSITSTQLALAYDGSTATNGIDAATVLATQIARISTKVQTDPAISGNVQPLVKIIHSPGFDWDVVMFGINSNQATSAQARVVQTLYPSLSQIATFTVTSESDAEVLVNETVGELQSLNPSVTSTDAVNFLASLEQESVAAVFPLLSNPNPSAADVEKALNYAIQADLQSASPSVQAIFATNSSDNTGPVGGTGTPGTGLTGSGSGSGAGTSGSGSPGGGGTGTTGSGTTGSGSDLGTSESTGGGAANTGTTGSSSGSSGGTVATGGQNTSGGSDAGQANADKLIGDIATVLATTKAGDAGGIVTAHTTGVTIQLSVPAGALAPGEQVTLTTSNPKVSLQLVSAVVPDGLTAISVIGVQFSGPTPTKPVTLTVTGWILQPGTKVYKLTDSGIVPVQAVTSAGKSVLTFSSDPYFLITTPTPPPKTGTTSPISWKWIEVNGATTERAPGMTKNGTTYIPIWYVMQALNHLHFTSNWDGHRWVITPPHGTRVNLSGIQLGHGNMTLFLNNTDVANVTGITAVDPSSKKTTTYMPIWYVMQALKRAGVVSQWDGVHWKLKD